MDTVHRGGPRTRSIEGVHGPSQDKGSMFCTFPPTPNFSTNTHDPPLFGTGNYNDPPPQFYLLASYILIVLLNLAQIGIKIQFLNDNNWYYIL